MKKQNKKTTITVSEDTWEKLKNKKKLGETIDHVINNALDKVEENGK